MSDTGRTPTVGAASLAGVAAALASQTTTGHLYIAEYGPTFSNQTSGSEFARCPPIRSYAVPFAATSVASLPFSPGCTSIRVHTDATCSLSIGGRSPVATAGLTGSMRMVAGSTEYYAVTPGDALAVIAMT